jgi:folate-binding protein YgfZ
VAGGLPCLWPGTVGSDVLDPGGDVSLPAGAVNLDGDGYEGLRIAAGVPRMGAEATSDTIPAELGRWVIESSVSFSKGCYTGQELVARIDSRGGNVPRHLRGLVVAGLPPAPGTPLRVDEREVGTVTSSAVDASGRTVALALVHRSVEPPATVTVGEVSAQVVDLPLTEGGSHG